MYGQKKKEQVGRTYNLQVLGGNRLMARRNVYYKGEKDRGMYRTLAGYLQETWRQIRAETLNTSRIDLASKKTTRVSVRARHVYELNNGIGNSKRHGNSIFSSSL